MLKPLLAIPTVINRASATPLVLRYRHIASTGCSSPEQVSLSVRT
eukprot:COSAG06_NODE_59343_length_274_cov_0.885714_1_plen_44_part_10